MIAEAIRRSPLADYAERFTTLYEATGGAVSVREQPFVTQINLRVGPRDQEVMSRLASYLGFGPPLAPNTVTTSGDRRALWLGSDEWLIVGAADPANLIEAVRDAVAVRTASIVDVSANRTVLAIQGKRARELLAHGVAIDLSPRAFAPGRCAQTLLAKAQVIIERATEDDQAFRLFVRSSLAQYVAEWLLDVAADPHA